MRTLNQYFLALADLFNYFRLCVCERERENENSPSYILTMHILVFLPMPTLTLKNLACLQVKKKSIPP